ncbi:hypothetical protein SK128_012958 [Halocaridina rubra]|uniref:Uncharacterized protein n=1 Tax=Halocaridina rubra TaxID=373956 RepID=A0AAN8X924_HALRR
MVEESALYIDPMGLKAAKSRSYLDSIIQFLLRLDYFKSNFEMACTPSSKFTDCCDSEIFVPTLEIYPLFSSCGGASMVFLYVRRSCNHVLSDEKWEQSFVFQSNPCHEFF